MLSLCVRRLASAAAPSRIRESSAFRCPTVSYDFVPADARDKGAIMDVTLNTLFTIEPHSRALGITADNGKELIDWIVSKALKYPHSYRIVHKHSGKLVGIRLMSEWTRGCKDDSDDIDADKLDESTRILASILDNLKGEFWKARPEAQKVLRRELTFVDSNHQRQGIAQHLVHLGLNFDRLRESNFDGIMSEASSIANQTLLAKNGYKELARSMPNEYVRSNGDPVIFPDDTKALKLFYLNLRDNDHS